MAGQKEDQHQGLSRRRALTGGAGMAMAIGMSAALRSAQTSAAALHSVEGIAGGGQVKSDSARAHFSVFASRFTGESIKEPVIVGQFQWVDTRSELTIVAKTVTAYGPFSGGSTNAREMVGTALLNDDRDEHLLTVRIADEGGPGSRKDTIAVFLGKPGAKDATSDPLYSFDGILDVGDIQLLDFDLPF